MLQLLNAKRRRRQRHLHLLETQVQQSPRIVGRNAFTRVSRVAFETHFLTMRLMTLSTFLHSWVGEVRLQFTVARIWSETQKGNFFSVKPANWKGTEQRWPMISKRDTWKRETHHCGKKNPKKKYFGEWRDGNLVCSVLQLWDYGHRQAGRLQRRSVFRIPGKPFYQPHRVCGGMGNGGRSWILDRPQLLGGTMGESSVKAHRLKQKYWYWFFWGTLKPSQTLCRGRGAGSESWPAPSRAEAAAPTTWRWRRTACTETPSSPRTTCRTPMWCPPTSGGRELFQCNAEKGKRFNCLRFRLRSSIVGDHVGGVF